MPKGSDSVQSRVRVDSEPVQSQFRVGSEPSEQTAIRTVYALSIHADYRCQHSGACCAADWDVPVELPIYNGILDALASRRLHLPRDNEGHAPFITQPPLPEGSVAVLATAADPRTRIDACVFFEHESRLCAVHRELGEAALPSACRHFPRIAVRDARGTFITLSHFCPTAAAMLFRDDVPLEIVESPPAFPEGEYEGLAANGSWPPLLHPCMLMDLEGYAAWERHMVARCADPGATSDDVVATLERAARRLRSWQPGGRSLRDSIGALPRHIVHAPAHASLEASLRLRSELLRAVPEELRPTRDESTLAAAFTRWVAPRWDDMRLPLKRYLAARAFANWCAYQGRGVCAIARSLEAALAVVRVEAARQCHLAARPLDRDLLLEAIRDADFLLNHLAGRQALADIYSRAEGLTPV